MTTVLAASETVGNPIARIVSVRSPCGSRMSMKPLMAVNLAKLSVAKVGEFKGCPPA